MRPWAWVRRILALVVTLVFVLGVAVAPAFAAKGSRSFSSRPSGTSSGSRSFSTPKTTAPSSPSRSFSSPPKTSTTPSSPSRSFSSPPPPSTSTPSPSYSSPDRSFSSGDRSYTSEDRSFTSQRPVSPSIPFFGTPQQSAPTYDTSGTNYPSQPPVVIYGPSTFDPPYWHDYYYGRPWYWRMWHRPVYYGDSGGWAVNWLSIVLVGFGIWVLLGVISAKTSRRRNR